MGLKQLPKTSHPCKRLAGRSKKTKFGRELLYLADTPWNPRTYMRGAPVSAAVETSTGSKKSKIGNGKSKRKKA